MSPWIVALLAWWPGATHGFCGLFVEAGQARPDRVLAHAVLLRQGTRTSLSISLSYRGPSGPVMLLLPVPPSARAKVLTPVPREVVDRLDELGAPLLEDDRRELREGSPPPATLDELLERRELDRSPYWHPVKRKRGVPVPVPPNSFRIDLLSDDRAAEPAQWLVSQHYQLPEGIEAALAPYRSGPWRFVAARVDADQVRMDSDGWVRLSPLRIEYESADIRLPLRLGTLGGDVLIDLVVSVIGTASRFDVVGRPTAVLPAGLEVTEEVAADLDGFYATLLEETLRKAGPSSVVTEYQGPLAAPSPVDLAYLGALPEEGPSRWRLTRLHTRLRTPSAPEDLVLLERRASGSASSGGAIKPADGWVSARPTAPTQQSRFYLHGKAVQAGLGITSARRSTIEGGGANQLRRLLRSPLSW